MDDLDGSSDRPSRRRGTLTKQPPPSVLSSRPSLRKPQSNASLQRHPSAPTYPRSYTPNSLSNRDLHQRTKSSAYGSSTSSLEQHSAGPSPGVAASNYGLSSTSALPYTSQYYQLGALPKNPEERDGQGDMIGATLEAPTKLATLHPSSTNPGYAGSQALALQRSQAPPLNHTHTSPDLRFHQVRKSQSFAQGGRGMMEITPPRSDNGTTSPKRYSDDGHGGKPLGPLRKKSGFSSFMNSMLGSPRTIKISAPENPVHMIHVGYDNVTGQFTVRLGDPEYFPTPRDA